MSEPLFKVGDVVKIIATPDYCSPTNLGQKGVIKSISKLAMWPIEVLFDSGRVVQYKARVLEVVMESKFKVGDYVTATGWYHPHKVASIEYRYKVILDDGTTSKTSYGEEVLILSDSKNEALKLIEEAKALVERAEKLVLNA